MSNSNTSPQGQSKATLPKQQSYEYFFKAHTRVCEKIYKKGKLKRYALIDTNAGSGYNQEALCDGSPIVALNVLSSAPFPWSAFFVEKSIDSCVALAKRFLEVCPRKVLILTNTATKYNNDCLKGCSAIGIQISAVVVEKLDLVLNLFLSLDNFLVIVNFDNEIVLSRFKFEHGTYGLIYADPNGPGDLCEQSIKTLFRRTGDYVDFLMNIDGQARKRVECGERKAFEENGKTWNKDNPQIPKYDNLPKMVKDINKKYCYVRQPIAGNASSSRWTLMYFSNYGEFNPGKLGVTGLEMPRIDTPKGKEVFAQVCGDKFPVSQDEQQLSLQIIL